MFKSESIKLNLVCGLNRMLAKVRAAEMTEHFGPYVEKLHCQKLAFKGANSEEKSLEGKRKDEVSG